jgi:hypothetical protein
MSMGFICNFSELIVSTELTSYDVNKLVNLMAKATEVIQARLFQPWLKSPFIYRLLGFKKTEDNLVSTTTAFMKEVGLQDLPCSIFYIGQFVTGSFRIAEPSGLQSRQGPSTLELSYVIKLNKHV